MLKIRKSAERGATKLPWLQSRHSFSFGNYFDPDHITFHSLRVLNEDVVAPGGGFPQHPHRNMEIFSYVVDGSLGHRDTLGRQKLLHRGWVQGMSAGEGIEHSEMNGSGEQPVHFLQIWILPSEENTPPWHEDRDFSEALASGELVMLASPEGTDGALPIGQDARIYAARPKAGTVLRHALSPGRAAWVQLISGELDVNGTTLAPGDGLAAEEEERLDLAVRSDAEFLLFDLAR